MYYKATIKEKMMEKQGYYTCNCDKYDPNCKCYPKPQKAGLDETRPQEEETANQRIVQRILDIAGVDHGTITDTDVDEFAEAVSGLGEYTTKELLAELWRRRNEGGHDSIE